MLRRLLLILALVATAASIRVPERRQTRAARRTIDLLAAKPPESKPPSGLRTAYSACGLATAAAWTKVVVHTIRSNAPPGAIMPSSTHAVFARTGVLSALPIMMSVFATLASASEVSWAELGSPTCRRLNLALVAAGVGSALWVGFAPQITQIPGSNPLASHWQPTSRVMHAALIGSYGCTAALSAAVWARSLPDEVRSKPLSWPGRVADGVAKSLVSLAPASTDDPVNVKYALLSSSFLFFTAMPILCPFPFAVCPSWAGRRCSRSFPAWTLLAAASSFSLKEAAESGRLYGDKTYRTLSRGLTGFGALYLAARVGALFVDPSFPAHYKIVTQVMAWQAAAAISFGLTLRPDAAP